MLMNAKIIIEDSNFLNTQTIKMKLKISTIQFAMLVCLFLVPCLIHAQFPGFTDDVVDDVPIDGGLSLLVAAGVGYGAKKIKEKRKK